jgi:hypothetical protein
MSDEIERVHKVRAHQGRLRSYARTDRGPVAGAGAQAASKEAAVIGILPPTSTDTSADGLHAVRKWLARWAARAIWQHRATLEAGAVDRPHCLEAVHSRL